MRKRLPLFLIFCTGFFYLHAQPLLFKSYTVYDGLVANPVRCIYQDSKGFMWIGTYEGLSRYDGYRFINYTTSNGLSHNFINSFFEIGNKLLVAENNGAIDVIQNSIVQKGFALTNAVNYITRYKDRILLSTDADGFYEYKKDAVIRPPQENVEVTLGHFAGYNDSLLVSDGIDNNFFVFTKDLRIHSEIRGAGTYFYSTVVDSKQRIWVCTSNGLKLVQLPTRKGQAPLLVSAPFPFNFPQLNNSEATAMLEEADGSFWIGTRKGLIHVFPDGTFQVYNEKDGLPSAYVTAIYRDRESNLWIGTPLGLAKWVSKNNVVFYNTEHKEFKNDIGALHLLPGKNLLLNSTHGLQHFSFKTKEFKDVRTDSFKFSLPIKGNFPQVVNSAGNIGVFDEERNTVVSVNKINVKVQGVYAAHGHPSGVIFLGSGNGVFAIHNSSIQQVLPYRITCMVVDAAGYTWVGSWQNGLYRIGVKSSAAGVAYDVRNVTSLVGNNEIRSLYEDSRKNIWVGTRYGGAFCLYTDNNGYYEKKQFNRRSGIMSDWVECFAETRDGDIWVGTYLGLDRLVREPGGYRVFNFSKATNFFAQIRSMLSLGDDHWVCVANTGIAFFKDEAAHQTPPLQASILSVNLGVLGNKLTILSPEEKVVLKPNQNVARFEFSALGFINEKQVLYTYRLKGSTDTAWSKPGNIHEASYESLSPGRYTFEVKTIGWNGKGGVPASFSFVISIPFWKQWWFVGLCIATIALFFYGFYRYRIRQLLRLQTVRNRIASDLHDDIGSTLTNISILSELCGKHMTQPEKAEPFLLRISEEVQASSQAMDDIIWSVNSRNDSLQETMARMRRYAAELFDNSEVTCHLQLDDRAVYKKLSMEQRRDVYLIYKEALSNIHKHARAANAWIEVFQNQNYLYMRIKDDGNGFNPVMTTHRNGLKNLRSRVEKWKGKIQIQSELNAGTAIELKLPLKG